MKNHLNGLLIGTLFTWVITAVLQTEINPFSLPHDKIVGMIWLFVIIQFNTHIGIIGYYNKDDQG